MTKPKIHKPKRRKVEKPDKHEHSPVSMKDFNLALKAVAKAGVPPKK